MSERRYSRLGGRIGRRRREYVLSHQPVCAVKECFLPSQEVDHIKPLFQGGPDTLENLQGLCIGHHREKTSRERKIWTARPRKKRRKGISPEWKEFIDSLICTEVHNDNVVEIPNVET